MEQGNNRIQLPLEEIKLAFAASCVEGAARKLGVPYIEIYDRMKKVDLINKVHPAPLRYAPYRDPRISHRRRYRMFNQLGEES